MREMSQVRSDEDLMYAFVSRALRDAVRAPDLVRSRETIAGLAFLTLVTKSARGDYRASFRLAEMDLAGAAPGVELRYAMKSMMFAAKQGSLLAWHWCDQREEVETDPLLKDRLKENNANLRIMGYDLRERYEKRLPEGPDVKNPFFHSPPAPK